MNRELITKKDYQILGLNKENATAKEISVAYEKLLKDYYPEKIKLEKLREPNDLEIEKYQEIEKTFKKFETIGKVEKWKYKCCGWKKDRPCTNEFYPCLWEKIEDGHSRLFCSQECYNSKFEFPLDDKEQKGKADEIRKKLEEFKQQNFKERKASLVEAKARKIAFLKRQLEEAKVKAEELEPNNRNFEQEINSVEVQNIDDDEATMRLYDIGDRIEKDIYSKKKEEKIYCDNCGEEIKQYHEPGTNHKFVGIGSVDSDGNRGTFCSEECSRKWHKGKWELNVGKPVLERLLDWMKKQGVTNISLDPDSDKLRIEYSGSRTETVEDGDLTKEQREIKNFFQNNKDKSLSQKDIEKVVNESQRGKNKNNFPTGLVIGGVILVVITGIIVLFIIKSKKRKRKQLN